MQKLLKQLRKEFNIKHIEDAVYEQYIDTDLIDSGDKEEMSRMAEIIEEINCIEMEGERENYSFDIWYKEWYEQALRNIEAFILKNY